jgi:hypothetical protein
MIVTCNQCSHRSEINAELTKILVCQHCFHAYEISGNNLISGGQFPFVPEDMTPLKIGSAGVAETKPFVVSGRIRYEFGESYFNHWVLYFKDKTWMWLGEGYGIYTLFRPAGHFLEKSAIDKIEIGTSVRVSKNKAFITTLIEQSTGFTAEGELPFMLSQFSTFNLIEGSDSHNELVGFKIFSNGEVESYQGFFSDFDHFQFTNLRQLNGWI